MSWPRSPLPACWRHHCFDTGLARSTAVDTDRSRARVLVNLHAHQSCSPRPFFALQNRRFMAPQLTLHGRRVAQGRQAGYVSLHAEIPGRPHIRAHLIHDRFRRHFWPAQRHQRHPCSKVAGVAQGRPSVFIIIPFIYLSAHSVRLILNPPISFAPSEPARSS